MKHEFTSEELLRFLEFLDYCWIVPRNLKGQWRILKAEIDQDHQTFLSKPAASGTPDECAEFLIEQWRKERGQ